MDANDVKTVLKQCDLFSTLEDSELDVLMEHGEVKQFSRGKIFYMKGEKSDDTFCAILSGSVNIVAKDGHIVRVMESGNIIGEVALSDPQHARTVTVITKDPVEVLEWNVNHIKEKIPGLWKTLLKLAWKNISHYYEE